MSTTRDASIGRRDALRLLAATAAGGLLAGKGFGAEGLPPVRAITRGPRFHWFGYYDKLEFDPSSRFVLGNQVDFEHRSPRPDDIILVGMVDTLDGDRWIDFGASRAWSWQQGCMLQWLPGSSNEVIWNDRQGDRFVSHVRNLETRSRRTLPAPIYAISPDGRWAIAPDFRRLADTRPGYGYNGIPDPNRDVLAPEDAGITRLDLRTGETRQLFSFREIAEIPQIEPLKASAEGAKHWFNHLLVAPDGNRFCFLHRWKRPDAKAMSTRLITCDPDGSARHVLDPYGQTSHFIWRGPSHILAWAYHPSHGNKFYLYEDRTGRVEVIAPDLMPVNGHCTYLPGDRWILNDTYPDKQRNQDVYLYDTKDETRHPLGHFRSPPEYTGEWRCDTHPRFSPDGTKVVIDSPHGGNGRQLYLIDVSGIVG